MIQIPQVPFARKPPSLASPSWKGEKRALGRVGTWRRGGGVSERNRSGMDGWTDRRDVEPHAEGSSSELCVFGFVGCLALDLANPLASNFVNTSSIYPPQTLTSMRGSFVSLGHFVSWRVRGGGDV